MATVDYTDKGYIRKYGGGVLKVRATQDSGTVKVATITGLTQANPGSVTAASHGFVSGDVVLISGISGMTEVNDTLFTVTVVNGSTFTIGVNTTGYSAYSSGGTAELANVWNLGYLLDTTLRYEKSVEDVVDESGGVVASLAGNAVVKLSGLLMQSNMTLLDFLRDSTEDSYYQFYYKMSPTGDANGTTQELFGGLAVMKPLIEVKAGTKRIPFEITLLKNDAAITVNEPDVVYGSVGTSDVTIVANKYYEITET